MFYTLSSRLLVPPNTIFVTDHTTGYFVNVLPVWLIVILSLECYIAICIDWLYVCFTALCFSHVEVRFDISVIKELIDWLCVDWEAACGEGTRLLWCDSLERSEWAPHCIASLDASLHCYQRYFCDLLIKRRRSSLLTEHCSLLHVQPLSQSELMYVCEIIFHIATVI